MRKANDDVTTQWKGGDGSARSIFTLFVDGISDCVQYHQVRGLFAQVGRVLNVFVQRQRKVGRLFRFGFVRFSSKQIASQAISLLNGVRLGDSSLSVTVARFPRPNFEVWGDNRIREEGRVELEGGLAGSWIETVRRTFPPSEDESLMIAGLSREVSLPLCFPPLVLFPEISCAGSSFVASHLSVCSAGAPQSASLGVLSDPGLGEGLAALPFEAPLPQVHVKTPRPRGRPKKSEKGGGKKSSQTDSSNGIGSMEGDGSESTGRELMVLPAELSNPYGVLTRARSALMMGKWLGMEYDCSDSVALSQIASQIMARRSS